MPDTRVGLGDRWNGRAAASGRPPRPVATLLLAALPMAATAWVLGAAVAPGAGLLAALAVAAMVGLTARGLATWPHTALGPANLVTLGRGALAMALVPATVLPPDSDSSAAWLLAGTAMLALALDGVDGALARRSGLDGPWGARLDMEVDSVFAALLALAIWRSGEAGPWVLLLGTLRYLWLGAARLQPRLGAPLPERLRRKAVCVIQIGTLITLLSPLVEPPLSAPFALGALALLAWSFAVDAAWLLRR